MRIVFLADAPYPHTQRWVEHFARRGDDCHVVSFRDAEIAGVTVHHVGGGEIAGKARYLMQARRVKRLIESLQPDVLHALHLTSYGFLGALSGVHPYVVSVWGTDVLEAPRLTPFHRWLTRRGLAGADAITATSLYLATETTRWAPPGAGVTVVPYGVDLERFAPPPSARGESDSVVIGTVARLSPEKGVSYLIEAFASLRQRYGSRVVLQIAGDGPERGKIEALSRRFDLEDAVELRGWVEPDNLPAFLHGLDLYVQPSVFEGFGVAAAEAAATALPVVATNVHGLPDIVRDRVSGLLVPPRDAAALAGACSRLIDDAGLRRAMGNSGHGLVARHYDWQTNARQMERLYTNVLNGVTRPLAVAP